MSIHQQLTSRFNRANVDKSPIAIQPTDAIAQGSIPDTVRGIPLGIETNSQRMALQQLQNLYGLAVRLENLSGSDLQDMLDEALRKMDEARRSRNNAEFDRQVALIRAILREMKRRGQVPR